MGIERDDREERQTRVDEMVREFTDAQRRRLMKVSERVAESRPGADAEVVSAVASAPAR